MTRQQIEEIIVGYAKQGMEPALIGQKLKNEHNVPYIKHYMGRKLGDIMKEKNLQGQMPADLMDLMKKAVNLTRTSRATSRTRATACGLGASNRRYGGLQNTT